MSCNTAPFLLEKSQQGLKETKRGLPDNVVVHKRLEMEHLLVTLGKGLALGG